MTSASPRTTARPFTDLSIEQTQTVPVNIVQKPIQVDWIIYYNSSKCFGAQGTPHSPRHDFQTHRYLTLAWFQFGVADHSVHQVSHLLARYTRGLIANDVIGSVIIVLWQESPGCQDPLTTVV